jgi:hypothetical protein
VEVAEERAHVLGERVGRLERGEVPAALELRPVDDRVRALGEAADDDIAREDGDAVGNAGGCFAPAWWGRGSARSRRRLTSARCR